jgi:chromosome segregation ATPase
MSYLSTISGFLSRKPTPEPIKIPIDYISEHLVELEHKLDTLTQTVKETDYDFNAFEESIFKLETKINEATEEARQSDLFWKIEDLNENLSNLKIETDFFDKEETLDFMSSDQVVADFDEESMSYDTSYEDY